MKEELLHGWLRQERPTEEELAAGTDYPSGYCHFPRAYGQEYFQQLCAEKRAWQTTRMGTRRLIWAKIYERNEALDARLIARAAACFAGLDRLAMRPAPKPRPRAPEMAPPPEIEMPRAAEPIPEARDGRVIKRPSPRRDGWLRSRDSGWLG